MKTKLFTGFAAAFALLIAGPAYAHDDHREGGGARGPSVASFHGGGDSRMASGSHFSTHIADAPRRTFSGSRGNYSSRGNYGHSDDGRVNYGHASRASVAFGGNSYHGGHGQYAFASHQGWNHNQGYFWNGHHYHWYGNGWFIVDPFPYYGYGYNPGYGYDGGGSLGAQVQSALYQQGYYQGPVDGIVGPGTRAAIAAYQRDNGLRVTGTITQGFLNTLGIG